MFGKGTQLKDLETRKRLLQAESDVNRIELARDFAALKDEVQRIKKQVRTVSSLASSAALFAGVVSLLRRRFFRMPESPRSDHASSNGKSWLAAALEGARIGGSLFMKVRSMLRDREHNGE